MRKIIMLGSIFLLFLSCFLFKPTFVGDDIVIYDGENNNITTEGEQYSISYYKDEFLEITSYYIFDKIQFEIYNNSKETIYLVWDETVFIDTEKYVHKVYHYGVKLIDRDKPSSPTPILSFTKLDEAVLPIDYTYYDTDYGWISNEFWIFWQNQGKSSIHFQNII